MTETKYKIGHIPHGKWSVFVQKQLPVSQTSLYWKAEGPVFPSKEEAIKELKKMKEGKKS